MLSKKKSGFCWFAALILLGAALICFNFVPGDRAGRESAVASEAGPALYASQAPLGHREGEQLPDFTIMETGGEAFNLSAYRGKTVVLNLWATWCGPCVKELPYFSQLQQAHPEDVKVLAIHSSLINEEDLERFLAGEELAIAFAVDRDGSVGEILGASAMLPQTLVINARGEVVYNQVKSITLSALEALVEQADQSCRTASSAARRASPKP